MLIQSGFGEKKKKRNEISVGVFRKSFIFSTKGILKNKPKLLFLIFNATSCI